MQEQIPLTAEYANERLGAALKAKDYEEVKKWDYLLRSINDYRVRNKQKDRQAYKEYLERKNREAYQSR